MSSYNVKVSEISPNTTEESLHDFFTFCGKIIKIDFDHSEQTKSATVHFEKASAAQTSLMLNGGTLDGATLVVTSEVEHEGEEAVDDITLVDQTDKPRAGIAAEYLARGYGLSEKVLNRAIEIDHKQGISERFLKYFKQFDKSAGSRAVGPDKTLSSKVHEKISQVVAQAKSVDEHKGYTKIAHEYYSNAVASPFGKKVLLFYTSTSKQISDIHEEARRIADQHKAAASGATNTVPDTAESISETTSATTETKA